MAKAIKAIILCGGQGTRIRDVADDIPKPMIRIGDRPVVWHIMQRYAAFGVKDFVLCLGYKGWVIKEFFLNYRPFVSDITVSIGKEHKVDFHSGPMEDWRVTLAETGEAAQTGARVWRARKYVEDCDLFCVTYGDGVGDIDFDKLFAFHKKHGKIATVTGVRPAGRFGVMNLDPDAKVPLVKEFTEKPQAAQGWINGGFFVFDQRLWKYMNDEPGLIFEHEPLQNLARDRELVVYEHGGFWQPMDTYREWKLLNDLWATGKAPWLKG